MNLKAFIKKYKKVSTHKKIQFLIDNYFLKNKLKNIKILEFGVDKGISSSLFLKFCQKTNSKLFSIDIIDYSKLFRNKNWKFLKCRDDNFKKINNFINWPVDVIFLDTQHTAKHTEKIFYMYFNKLKLNGLFVIDDISWLPYSKNAWRNNEWIENNNKETFHKLLDIYNANQKSFKISFYFEESGLAIITKTANTIRAPQNVFSREFGLKNILRKFF